ncbi:hypothetical protein J6TS1_00880 [Siminovitchia terrae]|uniref:Uncharacterized protein n=1 Tax=Siminovitchia terrae TaxID=1914933 RepID=A0ABQ4KQ96_SIMTE|nr:hypothetical protein J6TS1_00880 [Siminovitchia terrae]
MVQEHTSEMDGIAGGADCLCFMKGKNILYLVDPRTWSRYEYPKAAEFEQV